MRAPRWEYTTVRIDVGGWLGPDGQPGAVDAALDRHGDAGWELVSAFDVDAGQGSTTAIVARFERPRD